MSKQITLTHGKFALVDDADFEWLNQWKWYAYKSGKTWYAFRLEGKYPFRKRVTMHAQILCPPAGKIPDHKDGNGLNNVRENLRIATKAQNAANRGKPDNSTSEYKGVHWYGITRKWQARITVDGHTKSLGYFSDAPDAARAYDRAAIEHFGEFAGTNFPPR